MIIDELMSELQIQKRQLAKLSGTIKEVAEFREMVIRYKQVNKGKYYYLHQAGDTHETYVPQGKMNLVEGIKKFRLAKKGLEIAEENIKALEYAKKRYKPLDTKSLLEAVPKTYRDEVICKDLLNDRTEDEKKWKADMEAEKAKHAPFRPEYLRHKTSNGLLVRSKSEVLIAELLDHLGITYVYEMPTYINGTLYHPDFTIYSLKHRKIILLEHFGRLFDPRYLDDFKNKINGFMKDGFILWDNFLFTTEDMNGNIDLASIRTMLEACVL